jgi:pimeloyl-ACP methyl ester carboxylesterase
MTLDCMVQDGIEVTEYLRNHLPKDKILVLAHSFGSILGLWTMAARSDLFYACVGTGSGRR